MIFHAISRFSEDIDLAVDYEALGFTWLSPRLTSGSRRAKRTSAASTWHQGPAVHESGGPGIFFVGNAANRGGNHMSRCIKPGCKCAVWRHRLCFTHWRESQGWVFDLTRKVFIRRPE
jgi:hypothetical protein